jgi:hypothetical protein
MLPFIMRIVLVSGRTLAVNDFFNRYIYMARSGGSMTLKRLPIQYAYVIHFIVHDRLHNNENLGYGRASYNETGRIALGGNNKRWALQTV